MSSQTLESNVFELNEREVEMRPARRKASARVLAKCLFPSYLTRFFLTGACFQGLRKKWQSVVLSQRNKLSH